MINLDGEGISAICGNSELGINLRMANRHGLISGATGTGKTCTLQNLAETFSSLGVPVFATDIKGDLSGLCQLGGNNEHIEKSIANHHLKEKGFAYKAFPVCFWDIFGEKGHPVRTTISEMGPMLMGRLLTLNDTQSDVLTLIFKIADDNKLLLLDLKDLRKMVEYVGNHRSEYTTSYGNISPASIGAIQRSLLALEEQGGNMFFGEPAIDIHDFLQTQDGKGVINILSADKLMNAPRVYTSFLLYLLSELFEQLPEVGDLDKPKLVFFFDEAHLLFNDISKSLLEKIEQVVRLIRSKGVGVYFCTQNPMDIPDTVLGQLGNRVQHALRAYTPKDQKAINAVGQTFRQNPAFKTEEVIMNLGVGEALVSFLDDKGVPSMVEKVVIIPPEGHVGAIGDMERQTIIKQSVVFGAYENMEDNRSAFEVLTEQLSAEQEAKEAAVKQKEELVRQKEAEKQRKELEKQQQAEQRRKQKEQDELFGGMAKMMKTKAKREVVNTLFKIGRGLLGTLLGGKK